MSRAAELSIKLWPIVLALLIPTSVMHIEQKLFPVVEDFTITELKVEAYRLHISGYMRKVRNCTFAGITAEGSSFKGLEELPLSFRDSINKDSATRPRGLQGWGPWSIEVPMHHKLETVKLSAVHKCHPAWMTQTALVTIPVGDLK